MQIDWLDFALTTFEMSEHEKTIFQKERAQAAKKSDEVLLSGGGFSYDSFDKKFFQSKPELQLHNPTKKVCFFAKILTMIIIKNVLGEKANEF